MEDLYGRLSPDSEKMSQLLVLGFTEREARLGLRACGGDLQEAAIHISNQRQVRPYLSGSFRSGLFPEFWDLRIVPLTFDPLILVWFWYARFCSPECSSVWTRSARS